MSKICLNCHHLALDDAERCYHCGGELRIQTEEELKTQHDNLVIEASERRKNQVLENIRNGVYNKEQQNIPKCPTCGSTNITKISTTSKVAGAVAFGLFSKTAKSQFKCNNCGYKW